MLDVEKIRQDFPILQKKVNNKPIIYFDNACMSLKPKQVVEAMNRYFFEFPACGGRSMHKLGQKVTEEVNNSRAILKKFLNAKNEAEIVFTKNTTESINFVANSLDFKEGDVVLTTDKEHNSNLLPWQLLAKTKKTRHLILKSNSNNTFNFELFEELLEKNRGKIKLVSMVHTSNLDGATIPAENIIKIAHKYGALVMLDAAQSVPHKEMDVKKLDVDFLACSSHKMLGPSCGVLYGKYELLEKMNPFIVGGDTVVDTTYENFELEKPPEKFEAGLQNYAGIIGFAEAANYLMRIGRKNIERHEQELNKIITEQLSKINEVSLIGPENPEQRSGIFSFNIKGMDSHEVALMLDESANIMLRSGFHCVHSWFNAHKIKGSVRASLYLYNTKKEAEIFIQQVKKIVGMVK